jgi:hypothetical protein
MVMQEHEPSSGQVQLALPADLPALQSLLDRVNDYTVQRSGSPSWRNVETAYSDIEQRLEAGEVFVVRNQDGGTSATITLCETSDVWGESGREGTALYFTKFMKDPAAAEAVDAAVLLGFAAERARGSGKAWLRCDAAADHEGLLTYYQRKGFDQKGAFAYPSGRPGVLLEAPVDKF